MRTSFHHQPEAQHPKSSAIHKLRADYPIFWLADEIVGGREPREVGRSLQVPNDDTRLHGASLATRMKKGMR